MEKLITCDFDCKCFAKVYGSKCTLLREKIEKDKCPFAKPKRLYTNGRYYPINVNMI